MLRRNFFLLGRDRGSNPRQGELYHSKSSAPSRIVPQGRGLKRILTGVEQLTEIADTSNSIVCLDEIHLEFFFVLQSFCYYIS